MTPTGREISPYLEGRYINELIDETARRARPGWRGYHKWSEWIDAPELEFGDCLDFLAFADSSEVVALLKSSSGEERVEGILGTLRASDEEVAVPIREPEVKEDREFVLNPSNFVNASYWSADGWDYFLLTIRFSDGTEFLLGDNNAPQI